MLGLVQKGSTIHVWVVQDILIKHILYVKLQKIKIESGRQVPKNSKFSVKQILYKTNQNMNEWKRESYWVFLWKDNVINSFHEFFRFYSTHSILLNLVDNYFVHILVLLGNILAALPNQHAWYSVCVQNDQFNFNGDVPLSDERVDDLY